MTVTILISYHLFYFCNKFDIICLVIILNKNLSWLNDIKIAHRGLHNIEKGIPENTILAFEKAIERNVAIELDVHILKDNTIIVFHDDTLERACNIQKNIRDLTYKDIKKLKLFNTEYKIPTLIDTLDYIDLRVPIILEVKTDVKAKVICPVLIKILDKYKGKIAIKSFDPNVCIWFKKNAQNYVRGLLITDFKNEKKHKLLKKILLSSLILMPICKPDFLSVNKRMLKCRKIKKIRNKKVVLGWTFRSNFELLKYENYCDSYICEEKTETYI